MINWAERRKTPRVPIQVEVSVEWPRGTLNGVGRDLSEGGIGVYLKRLPPVGSQIKVTFRLPTSDSPIEVTGEVRYHGHGEEGVHLRWIGVRFMRMDGASLGIIQRFVAGNRDASAKHPKPPPLPAE